MNSIEIGKRYKTRGGESVEVVSVSLRGTKYPVLVIITAEDGLQYTEQFPPSGRIHDDGREHPRDLIEVPPYSDIPIDTRGWARDNVIGSSWTPAYFSGVDPFTGKPTAWMKTSAYTWDEFTTTKPKEVS